MKISISVPEGADTSAILIFRSLDTGRDSGQIVIDPGHVGDIDLADSDQIVIGRAEPSGRIGLSSFLVSAAGVEGQGELAAAPEKPEPTLEVTADPTPKGEEEKADEKAE